ncbi:hypothetical protein PTTG_03446 [Puccinia triticina 1-1 BBBD Race 1]|uniref:Uncharacterized protein n=1 Tax=Puccinia triticina (isolate 1-1 / race 1 (BBBD)) TaxID=630390 RepID=A0A0C4ERM7_PUCT1|nr:hypothetical protein PTTG_03446 [Puccinia triticina 1-1 BBBD Race 1]
MSAAQGIEADGTFVNHILTKLEHSKPLQTTFQPISSAPIAQVLPRCIQLSQGFRPAAFGSKPPPPPKFHTHNQPYRLPLPISTPATSPILRSFVTVPPQIHQTSKPAIAPKALLLELINQSDPINLVFFTSVPMSQPTQNQNFPGQAGVQRSYSQTQYGPPSTNSSGSEIHPQGLFPPLLGCPNSLSAPVPLGQRGPGPLQASLCSYSSRTPLRDVQLLQNPTGVLPACGTPIYSAHSNPLAQIGPRGSHPNPFIPSPLDCLAPAHPTHGPQSSPPFHPTAPRSSENLPPPFQFSSAPLQSKPAPKKQAPRKKNTVCFNTPNGARVEPTPSAPLAQTQSQPVPLATSSSTPSQQIELSGEPNADVLNEGPAPSVRQRAPPEVMERIQNDPLDQLRDCAVRYTDYVRLLPDDKVALEEAYRQYQRAVHLIVIERRLHPQPALQYLGNEVRIRGPTNFKNFCKYNEVASPIYHDKSQQISDQMVQCGELWRKLDQEEQDLWRDQDFLNSISPPNDVSPGPEDSPDSVTQWKKQERFKLTMWVRKVKRDLKNMSTSHQVKGFFALASRDPNSPKLITGGSILAEEFLDVLESGSNTCKLFFNFINGQKAVKEILGQYPWPSVKRKRRSGKEPEDGDCPYNLGSKVANAAIVCAELKQELAEATHGAWTGGWPGTKTTQKLRDLGVTLQVWPNNKNIVLADFCARPLHMRIGQTHRILTAFANGWVRLIGPPNLDASDDQIQALGHEPDSDDPDGSP